ncbi:hypothetical protein Poli38472_005703 [Pythium oligandrum]|uniref:Very-long-chain 3-oxoacyl-CoA synthase n=1 Tax=Pythium oligandrum TaxID=41045 RepID=A0A8K1CH21_PYTOL|nr:hypothetical protein Poli38472_005703 [Pythium oligandrum]|eukprot:TMW63085.1 hypothetical protein Poli38472_005703 [Pythium oligandrum]
MSFASAPILVEELPFLSALYPFEWERKWEITWEPEFCHQTMRQAILLCAAYFVFCFGGRWIMENRKPFDLRIPLALWNLALAVFSFMGSVRTAPFLLNTLYRRGVYNSVCATPRPHYGHGPVGLWVTLFIFSKVPELVDTAFIVLRKKPLIFLHWYHHITVLLFCWHAFATQSASGLYFVAMNYSVHAIMYFYYFLTAVGYRPWWAQFVTVAQLSQMVVGVIVCFLNVHYLREGLACDVDKENLKWGIIMYSSYFALFLKFFIQRYFFKSTKPVSKKKTASLRTDASPFTIEVPSSEAKSTGVMGIGGGGDDGEHLKLADPEEATYFGRVRKTFHQLDFRTAFTTHEELKHALDIVAAKKHSAEVDADEYARALKIKHAIVHPDTGEAVFTPLRVSMIVPMNVMVDCGMLLANSTKTTILAQWLNQTYNALHYYANRNASNEDTAEQRLVAYIGATASSVAGSLGIRRWAKHMRNVKWAPIVARMGPFGAVAAADLLNLAVMRQSEYLKGVNVYDENGDSIGKSKRCGAFAVSSCIAGRIFAAAPILIVPPLIMRKLEPKPWMVKRPWLKLPILLTLVGTAIQFSVPLTFGLFRQTAQVPVHYLEPEFRGVQRRRDGESVQIVTYNKGI